jgi:hypothetical protein
MNKRNPVDARASYSCRLMSALPIPPRSSGSGRSRGSSCGRARYRRPRRRRAHAPSILRQNVDAAKLFRDRRDAPHARWMAAPHSQVHHHRPAGLIGIVRNDRDRKAIGASGKPLQPFGDQRGQVRTGNSNPCQWRTRGSSFRQRYTIKRILHVKACRRISAGMHHPVRWEGEVRRKRNGSWPGISGGCAGKNPGRSTTSPARQACGRLSSAPWK